MASSVNIGDSQTAAVQPIVADIGTLDIVTQASIADIADPVNDALVSGKKKGAMYLMSVTAGGMDIVVADGPATDDDWFRISDAGATPITPA